MTPYRARRQATIWALIGFSIIAVLAATFIRAQDADQAPTGQWPYRVDTSDGQITIYQPQLSSLDDDTLKARSAVSLVKSGQSDPIFGAVWFTSRLATDRTARTAKILDFTVTKIAFPDGSNIDQQALTSTLTTAVQQQPMTMSLDELVAALDVDQKEKAAGQELQNDPPKIIFRDHPAVLVQYDGAPKLVAVANLPLMRADNTPFFVMLDPGSKTYYLKGAGRWFAARDAMGPFQPSAQVPAPISQLADQSGYQDPQQAGNQAAAQATEVEILTASDPTELIWTDGPEELTPIANTNLLYVANTPSDEFMSIDTQQRFVLLSGRWYTAARNEGPWTYVAPDKLPADFAQIPPNSPKGDVLAQVTGTQQAKEAVADTFIPQTAAIDRTSVQPPQVAYDGDPQFESVEGTDMTYAVNTSDAVLRVGNEYFCCADAVWYQSLSPAGPWSLALAVPPVVYTIPPSCPIYPVRYCYIYETTPEVVYCGYLPGYVGCYRRHGVVVYGTGYHYRPWAGHVYYPRPATFGFAARYDAYTGHWGFSVGLNVHSAPAWIGVRRDPLIHNGGWFGPGGFRPQYVRHDVAVRHVQVRAEHVDGHHADVNLYQQRKDVRQDWNPRAVQPRTPAVKVDHPIEVRGAPGHPGEVKPVPGRPAEGKPAPGRNEPPHVVKAPEKHDDVYADPQGNVYRRTDKGWERRDQNKWVPSEPKNEPPIKYGLPAPKGLPEVVHGPVQPGHETPQPAHENPQPTREIPQPAHEAPQPSHEAPGPTHENPQPSHETPRPAPGPSQSPHEIPQPAHETPKPAHEAPQPSRDAPQPAHETPKVVHEAPQPSHEAPQPARQAPQPAREAPAPARQVDHGDLDHDFKARNEGADRAKSFNDSSHSNNAPAPNNPPPSNRGNGNSGPGNGNGPSGGGGRSSGSNKNR